ncbi:MAG: Peptide deformylase [Parcubacteria group bacterium GW2011_GWA2_49_16]|nr:MAG: Peptide deformylase [Parcubacteria group bacterium GW2011_GWA2_49_16]
MRTILPEQKNPVLRKEAERILLSEIKSRRIQNLIKEMKALLAKEEFGVALAAPQVGEAIRLFIVSGRALARGGRNTPDELGKHEEVEVSLPDQVYINPELIKLSRSRKEKHEGCLSVRGLWGIVRRAEKATIRAYDESGVRFTRGTSGFLAHIFQHEMDHLGGILYTDKATELYKENEDRKQ